MAKVNEICKTCVLWHMHKEKCWYHWDFKKVCTQKIEMNLPEEEKNNVSKTVIKE